MIHYLGHGILWELKNNMDSFFTENMRVCEPINEYILPKLLGDSQIFPKDHLWTLR